MPRYVLRYGSTRAVGLFAPRGQDKYVRGMRVIARTPRGLEAAEVLAEATDEQAKLLEGSPGGQIMREMSAEDANELSHLQQRERTAFEACQKHVTRLALPMQLVDVEHVFGGERLVVYYISEERVDFRELVKALASEFQTRIEMRQIGVRDEAKLLADYGDCGQPVCCGTFLSEMPPVSMKMAKVQKATLDPTKISGRCGRLKCCLRYEYETYRALESHLPAVGAIVVTSKGRGRVVAQEILAQKLVVEFEDRRRIIVGHDAILSVELPRGRPAAGPARDADDRDDPRLDHLQDEEEGPADVGTRMDSPP